MKRSTVAAMVTVSMGMLAPAAMASGAYQAAAHGYAPEEAVLLAQAMTEQEGGMGTTGHEHEASSGAEDVFGSGGAPIVQEPGGQAEAEGEASATGSAPTAMMGGGMTGPGAMGGPGMARMMPGGGGGMKGGRGMMGMMHGRGQQEGMMGRGMMRGGMMRGGGGMKGGSGMMGMMHGGDEQEGMMYGGRGMMGRHEDVLDRLERIERRQIIIETMLRELLLGR